MIKLVHFADVHLGSETYGRWDPETGLSLRLTDFLASLDSIVDRALAENADLAIFAGDAYKSRDPTPTYQREFAKRILRMAQAGIEVVMITGNHDTPNAAGKAHALDIFNTLEVPSIHVMHQLSMDTILTRSDTVQIVALPWITRSVLLAHDEHKGLSLEEINDLMVEKIANIVTKPDGGFISRLDPSMPHVLVSHSTVQGGVYGSERSVMLGQEMVFPPSMITHPAFDYVALGHLHRHQVIADRPPTIYSGSVERIDFGEEGEQKGFILAEVERGGAEWQFVPLSTRPFVTIDTEAAKPDPTAQVVASIAQHDIRDAVVRLIIHTNAECEVLLRNQDINRALSPAFHVTSINRDVERPIRARLGMSDTKSLGPPELLARYFEVKGVSPERQKLLMRCAEEIMAEVEEEQS
jgi:exonuclease SbcD